MRRAAPASWPWTWLGQRRHAASRVGLSAATGAYSPLLKYEWAPTYEPAQPLRSRPRWVGLRRRHDGLRQIQDRRPVTQTIGATMQMLRSGERTKARAATAVQPPGAEMR